MFKINLIKKLFVFDIETDGLLDDLTKIHCLSMSWIGVSGNIQTKSTTDYAEMRKFFENDQITRVGHNITLYDERAAAKILGVDTLSSKDQIIDTLALSWYLFPEKKKHGLEEWGEVLGTKKVEIKDWKNLTTEQYIERCETDTVINMKLWLLILEELRKIYDTDDEIIKFIQYLQFKMDCVREQEDTRIQVDIPFIEKTIDQLEKEKLAKTDVLQSAMPKVAIKKLKTYKDVIVLENGDFFEKGDMMYNHYFDAGYRPKREHTVETIKGYNEPNANSVDQKKQWLFDLGWKPQHYKENEKGKKVPQIGNKEGDGSVCESIKDLFEVEPALEVLEGLGILGHRIGLLKGFLKNQKNGYMEASMAGLTNTLRLKHSNVVNLPGVNKKYGTEIRGSFIANPGDLLCGSDMSSLEDSTKQHYIYNYDPKYVMEMRTPGFDPHFDIAVLAGLMTQKQLDAHNAGTENHKKTRQKAKVVNFSGVYGAGAKKIADTAGISLKAAKELHKIYWQRNKAVKDTADACEVKQVGIKKWLKNPISGFWYSLRAEKDRFSTLNQGTGVYCFDTYVKYVREQGIKISLQMHDEILFNLNGLSKEQVNEKLNTAITKVNEEIKLNIPLGISADFGQNYAECH